jgi:hypothetical protein
MLGSRRRGGFQAYSHEFGAFIQIRARERRASKRVPQTPQLKAA